MCGEHFYAFFPIGMLPGDKMKTLDICQRELNSVLYHCEMKICFFFLRLKSNLHSIYLYSGAYGSLLRELVAEFTLTDNPANTTTSLLRSMCYVDDSVILGSWLQETDHKAIEDQVSY